MSQKHLPNQKSWDQFWSKDYKRCQSQGSWSKRRIEKILLSCNIVDGKIVDAGCGSGYFSRFFCDQGCLTVALDYSTEALQVARCMTQDKVQTVQADLVHGDLSQNFPEKNVACFFSDGLFEHFEYEDQDRILKNFELGLKEDGVIVTFVPNRWSSWQLIRPFFMPGIKERPFILKELKLMHERNGFKIVVSGGINVLPFRFSPEFLGSKFGMLLYVIARKIRKV